MNWFKLLKISSTPLAKTIAVWLQQSKTGNHNMAALDADINQHMSGVTDVNALEQAINEGIDTYRRDYKENGPLLPGQEDLVNNLKRRFANQPARQPIRRHLQNLAPQDGLPQPLPEPVMQPVEAPVSQSDGMENSNV